MPLLTPSEISQRADAIRLKGAALASAAGLPGNAAARTLNGSRPSYDRVEALSNALIGEEKRMRDYLIGLHPLNKAELPEVA
jgi:hypothetical protein